MDTRLSPILARLSALEAHLIQGTEEDELLARKPPEMIVSSLPRQAGGIFRTQAGHGS